MSIFTKMTIAGRFRLAFGSLLVVLLLLGGVGLYQADQIYKTAVDLGENRVPSIETLGRLSESIARFRQLEGSALLATDTDQAALVAGRMAQTSADIDAAWKVYAPLVDPGEEARTLFPAAHAAWTDFQTAHAKCSPIWTTTSVRARLASRRAGPP
jgi:methyl-accepting chemotaxis protein